MSFYTLPSGKYFIGDISYIFNNRSWDEIVAVNNFNSAPFEVNASLVWAAHTANGDGEYEDQNGNKYPVDSGVLGAVPIDLVENPERESLGAVMNAPHGLEVSVEDGVFRFNEIVIDTDPDTHFGSLDGGYDLDPNDDVIF